jgi:hypothetical protein
MIMLLSFDVEEILESSCFYMCIYIYIHTQQDHEATRDSLLHWDLGGERRVLLMEKRWKQLDPPPTFFFVGFFENVKPIYVIYLTYN